MENLKDGDVVRTDYVMPEWMKDTTFLHEDLFTNAYKKVDGTKTAPASLFRDGVPCQVLQPGRRRWRKGKIRLVLVFDPNEDEIEDSAIEEDSLLQEIHQKLGEQ